MVRFTFPRELRLLTPRHFAFVFQQPQRVSALHVVILGRQNTLGHPRLGLTIAKKHVKPAYERNRIRRLTRESFRLHQYTLPAMDFVVIAKKGIAHMNNQTLTETLGKLWHHHCHYSQSC